MDYDDISEERYDIVKTTEQLKEAWQCVPHWSLVRLIDELIVPDMTPEEVSDVLDEFIHQNE